MTAVPNSRDAPARARADRSGGRGGSADRRQRHDGRHRRYRSYGHHALHPGPRPAAAAHRPPAARHHRWRRRRARGGAAGAQLDAQDHRHPRRRGPGAELGRSVRGVLQAEPGRLLASSGPQSTVPGTSVVCGLSVDYSCRGRRRSRRSRGAREPVAAPSRASALRRGRTWSRVRRAQPERNTEREPEAATARAIRPCAGSGPSPPGPPPPSEVVVVAQAEEPDEPDDQQSHVEDAEADHEDPALGAHASIKRDSTAREPDSAPRQPVCRLRPGRVRDAGLRDEGGRVEQPRAVR